MNLMNDVATLPMGDIISWLNNAKGYGQLVGGAIVGIMGLFLVIWGTVKGVLKITSKQAHGDTSWFVLVVALVIGLALSAKGLDLVLHYGQDATETLESFGNMINMLPK